MSTPGIAGSDSFQSHPSALKGAVFPDSFHPILRTGRCVPAISAQHRRQYLLIKPDQQYEEIFKHSSEEEKFKKQIPKAKFQIARRK